jgi:hypothetical protein
MPNANERKKTLAELQAELDAAGRKGAPASTWAKKLRDATSEDEPSDLTSTKRE